MLAFNLYDLLSLSFSLPIPNFQEGMLMDQLETDVRAWSSSPCRDIDHITQTWLPGWVSFGTKLPSSHVCYIEKSPASNLSHCLLTKLGNYCLIYHQQQGISLPWISTLPHRPAASLVLLWWKELQTKYSNLGYFIPSQPLGCMVLIKNTSPLSEPMTWKEGGRERDTFLPN